MLEFQTKVKVLKLTEVDGKEKREEDFDWNFDMASEIEEYIEYLIGQIPYISDSGEVFALRAFSVARI